MTKLEQYLKGSDPDPVNAKMRHNSLAVLYKEYFKYNDELVQLDPENPQLTEFLDVESRYFDVASAVTKLQRIDPIANSTLNASNITVTERQDLPRLAEIKLPTFTGKCEEWARFKNKFISLVHSRTDLSDAVKCSHLFDSLSDKALETIAHYDPSEKDYKAAWQSLLEFFDQKHIVANQHLNAMLDLPKLSKATLMVSHLCFIKLVNTLKFWIVLK